MTPIKVTPLYAATNALGAEFVEPGGWRFAKRYAELELELTAARERVGLADVSSHGKLFIEGVSAFEAVRATLGSAPENVGSGMKVAAGQLYRLRLNQFYLSTPVGGEGQAHVQLETVIAAQRFFVTVTNQTHGLADVCLIGPASRAVLSKLCSLDFADQAFPNQSLRQTSVAKTKQMIIRRDFGPLPGYTLIGAQSLAAYLWNVIRAAGHEFGIAPVGVEALRELEK